MRLANVTQNVSNCRLVVKNLWDLETMHSFENEVRTLKFQQL